MLPDFQLYETEKLEYYAFQDNGANVLAVAHGDTVGKTPQHAWGMTRSGDETWVISPTLDDRLGVYTLVHMLPKLGIVVDCLITDEEENANSTGRCFETVKEYNWIVEFDRHGDDAVTYDYDWENVVRGDFMVGSGTFSDISWMNHLGCQAVNVGVGYYAEHTKRSYMVVEEYLSQMKKFMGFYEKHRDTHFPMKEKKSWRNTVYSYASRPYSSYQPHTQSWWDDEEDDTPLLPTKAEGVVDEVDEEDEVYYLCENCTEEFFMEDTIVVSGVVVCPQCGLDVGEEQRRYFEDDKVVDPVGIMGIQ